MPTEDPNSPSQTPQQPIPSTPVALPMQFFPGVPAPPLTGLYFPILHDIDANLAKALIDTINQSMLTNQSLARVYLPISCNGGSVPHALAIYEYLRSLSTSIEVITHNIGAVDSAAVLIYLAGSKRRAAAGTTFLLHPVRNGSVFQNPSIDDATAMQVTIARHQMQYADIVAERTNIKKAMALRYMKSTKVLAGGEAQSAGLVDSIEALPAPLAILR